MELKEIISLIKGDKLITSTLDSSTNFVYKLKFHLDTCDRLGDKNTETKKD